MPACITSHTGCPANMLRLKRSAEILLRRLDIAGSELSILLVDDAEIAELNRRWFNRARPTNVISFGQHYGLPGDAGSQIVQADIPVSRRVVPAVLGDIVISVETARREAVQADTTLDHRLTALMIHGLAHLMGEDHELGPDEAIGMARVEMNLAEFLYKEEIMADLCINVDHIATIRQARGTDEPDPVIAAGIVELAGADGIVVHLREDRRHIQDRDVELLRQTIKTRMTLEMAATDEMIRIASRIKPDIVTLVPEKRRELTTEGGLDVVNLEAGLTDAVSRLHGAGIPVSLFVDPEESQIEASAGTGTDCIEIHTGRYADAATPDEEDREFEHIVNAARLADGLGLRVHAGHGLNYRNTSRIAAVSEICEFSIGHAVIAHSAIVGLDRAVKEMLSLVKKGTPE